MKLYRCISFVLCRLDEDKGFANTILFGDMHYKFFISNNQMWLYYGNGIASIFMLIKYCFQFHFSDPGYILYVLNLGWRCTWTMSVNETSISNVLSKRFNYFEANIRFSTILLLWLDLCIKSINNQHKRKPTLINASKGYSNFEARSFVVVIIDFA